MASARVMTLKVAPALAARIDAAARQRGVSRSRLVREAVEALLGQPQATGTVRDLTPDLSGCVQGRFADLSTNRKRLRGFGR